MRPLFACVLAKRGRLAEARASEDACRVHALVCRAMGGQRSQLSGYLWALDGAVLYVRATALAATSAFKDCGIDEVFQIAEPTLQDGANLDFRAWVVPTIRRSVPEAEKTRKNQRREPVEGSAWLKTKLADAATVIEVEGEVRVLNGWRRGALVTLGQYVCAGELMVKDAAKLERLIDSGIGPAKGYGNGLVRLLTP